MNKATLILSSLLLLSPLPGLQAQVYETTDEDGNTVFTDTPPTDDASPVDLGSPNIADSVEVRPPAPAAEPPAKQQAKQPAPSGESTAEMPVYVDGDDDRREELYEERRRHERRADNPGLERPVTRPAPHPGRR